LGADQNVYIALAELAQYTMVVTKVPHGIPINTTDAGVWKKLLQLGFQPSVPSPT
jgi:hypothetical protein